MIKFYEKYGFNRSGKTYIYFPKDSYFVKEDLKRAGFKFSKELLWHIADPANYTDKCVEVDISEVCDEENNFVDDIRKIVDIKIKAARPAEQINTNSNWIGEIGERISNVIITLKSIKEFDGAYGRTQVAKFEDEDGNKITWFTQAEIKINEGEDAIVNFIVKKHDTYNGERVTIISRLYFKK